MLPVGTRSEFDLQGWSSRDQSDTHCRVIFGPLPPAVTKLGLMAACDIWEPGWDAPGARPELDALLGVQLAEQVNHEPQVHPVPRSASQPVSRVAALL